MKLPGPPLLELGYYFAGTDEQEAFSRILHAVLDRNETALVSVDVHRGKEIRRKSFASVLDELIESIASESFDSSLLLSDPDVRPVRAYVKMDRAPFKGPLIVTFVDISERASAVDHHPLAIVLDGSSLSPEQPARRGKASGQFAYGLFKELTLATDPSYGALTVEYGLQCPTDLAADPRSLAFRDFFVSETFMGSEGINRLAGMFADAYNEQIGKGRYFSTTAIFNPLYEQAEEDPGRHSRAISQLIGSLAHSGAHA